MVNTSKTSLDYIKKSIYYDLREFYDRNQGVLYNYQDFEIAGIKEYRVITNKVSPLKEYEKNRLVNELMRIFIGVINDEKDLSSITGFVTLNPIINYYGNIVKAFIAMIESDKKINNKLSNIINNILLKSNCSEEVKLALTLAPICNIDGLEKILDVFSIHNDYIFYVINDYKYLRKSNNYIFELAKKSIGYGRFFCIRELQPVNCEITKWMIEEGSDDNVAVAELLCYSMLSIELLEYLENTQIDSIQIEKISKSFNMLLLEYGLDEIKDSIKVCQKLLKVIDEINGGIYSLYAVISILYSVETMASESSVEENDIGRSLKYIDCYKNIITKCNKICKKKIWNEIVKNELSNIEVESCVVVTAAEKIGYKLKKKEFELILNRDPINPLLYKHAFSKGNKAIKAFALNFALKKFPMDNVLCGQDNLNIDSLDYRDIIHVCFFIILKYMNYEEFKDQYKELSLKALRSPLIETRTQALLNLQSLKGKLDLSDKEIIKNNISEEMIISIKRGLDLLLNESNEKVRKFVSVDEFDDLSMHVKDIYLNSIKIAGTKCIDMSEVYNILLEKDIVYLKREVSNPYDENAIQIVTTQGYVIGYVPEESNLMLRNLIDNGKYIYGNIKKINDSYEEIIVDLYLSYKDVIDEITSTLSLLSGTQEYYLQ